MILKLLLIDVMSNHDTISSKKEILVLRLFRLFIVCRFDQ